MKVRNLVSSLAIVALASSQVAFAATAVAGNSPITGPVTSPITAPITSPITIPTPSAPTMVYPQNNQTLDLEGAYMFKVNPVPGASGYLFGFFQDNKMVFENYRDLHSLSSAEFNIRENDPAHAKFHAGNVEVWIRAKVNGQWSDARVITITLKPRRISTPVMPNPAILRPIISQALIPAPKPVVIPTSTLSGNVNYRMITYLKMFNFTFPIQSIVTPASGSTVELTNTKTQEKVYASTNWLGTYSVNLKNGQYQIKVSDAKKTVFNPGLKIVDLNKNISNTSFEGVLQTIRFW